jgi:hypothetical protein
MDTELPDLPLKMRKFCEAYLETWVGKTAAERAGYSNPRRAAWNLMQRPRVKEYLKARLQQLGMPADEVITRLSQQARANVGDFYIIKDEVDPDTGEQTRRIGVDWDLIKERGYLVKRISYSKRGDPIIELHDPQAALVQVGKAHGLFKDINEISGRNGAPLTWSDFIKQGTDDDADPKPSSE